MSDYKQSELSTWYEEHSASIFKYICMMTHDYQLAEDLTHDTFIKAYKYFDSFEGKASPKTWLFRIAHNVTIDYIRKQKPLNFLKEIIFSKGDAGPSAEEMVEIKENSKELYEALSKLNQSYREVIILRKIKGFSIQETKEILNWSESKVKTTLYRALPALEEQLVKGGFLDEAR
ncbi:RNA polymerase sigma factor [Radiobacillus sp. PE A8.2]|uniref:RNA polymerase sigma factor n=1 Tax=Radiobacillus sp. PE A8.2 TaxID=3380349 RepID=UPI00388DEA9F